MPSRKDLTVLENPIFRFESLFGPFKMFVEDRVFRRKYLIFLIIQVRRRLFREGTHHTEQDDCGRKILLDITPAFLDRAANF